MADFSMFVPNVHFEQIPIKNLVSNQEYQRNISEQHVLNAAAHFDLYQINPVKDCFSGFFSLLFFIKKFIKDMRYLLLLSH